MRFSAADLPAYWSGWTTRCAFDASGRSFQISSIGLRSTATSSAPRVASASFAFFTQSRVCSHGIVADARALGRMLLEPFGGARLGHRLVAPLVGADLLADLERVAAVDEDRRFLGKHHRGAGRALEPGQPGEPLGVAADIFAHMLVGQRHDEAVELLGLQLLAKGGEAVGVTGHGLAPLPLS